jgi:hypothetical protein
MLALKGKLMPDQPAKGPPSSAPLSAEDADRIADSFTPFWEDDGDPAPAAAPALAPVAAAPIVVPAARRPIAKQTLLGIAPPTIVRAPAPAPAFASADATQPLPAITTQPPPAITTQPLPVVATQPPPTIATQPLSAVAAMAAPVSPSSAPVPAPAPLAAAVAPPAAAVEVTQPLPAVTAPQPPPAPLPHNKTLLGYSSPAAAAHADPTATPSPALKSSPNVPGYAIAYTPKDGPSTPAVVIAPEAQSEPENKRPMSLTVPVRVRAPVEAPVHVQQKSIAIDDDFDPYAPRKGKGKLIGAVLGGVVAIAAGLFAIRALSGGAAPATGAASEPLAAAPAKDKASDVQAAAPAPVAPIPAAAPDPSPSATAAATTPPEPAPTPIAIAPTRPPVAARAPTPVAAKPATAARPKAEPVAATPTRPAARPPAATVPSDTNSAPTKPASKGVIVRDAPF